MGIDKIPDPLNITNGKCHDDYSAGKRDRGKETPLPPGNEAPRLHRTGDEASCSIDGCSTKWFQH